MNILELYRIEEGEKTIPDYSYFTDIENEFKITEDEVDIQSIEELAEDRYIVTDVLKKINELVQAIKQLDNKIKEK